ncbi:MAG: hypothetical protein PHW77_01090 [Eubacteriales bacterium]|nr:hypothetical protein [Eubacteriales bacterium]
MKNKFILVASVLQLIIGSLAVISFVILALNGVDVARFIIALILAIGLIVLGTFGIVENKGNK